jgi:hypothetical protein
MGSAESLGGGTLGPRVRPNRFSMASLKSWALKRSRGRPRGKQGKSSRKLESGPAGEPPPRSRRRALGATGEEPSLLPSSSLESTRRAGGWSSLTWSEGEAAGRARHQEERSWGPEEAEQPEEVLDGPTAGADGGLAPSARRTLPQEQATLDHEEGRDGPGGSGGALRSRRPRVCGGLPRWRSCGWRDQVRIAGCGAVIRRRRGL